MNAAMGQSSLHNQLSQTYTTSQVKNFHNQSSQIDMTRQTYITSQIYITSQVKTYVTSQGKWTQLVKLLYPSKKYKKSSQRLKLM